MERIVYNKTLDTHKSGVQFTLQGFETADKMSRRIVISLMASGDTIDLPLEQLEAVMYVSTPGIEETSINSCTIEGNNIVYDCLPIIKEGTTVMQLKLIESRPDGAVGVLAAPKFAVEVVESEAEDESIKGTATYTSVEEAIARAKGVYDTRLLRIALHSDCMFYVYYADGTIYESDVLKELFLKGDALVSQSYAVGGTGVRDGEETDNSKYYSNVSRSMSLETKRAGEDALSILNEVKKHGVYTIFDANFETGELIYESPKYDFDIDKESGELHIIGKAYNIDETMRLVAEEWLRSEGVTFPEFKTLFDDTVVNVNVLNETVAEHSEIVERVDGTVLWENPNTSVEFAGTTLDIDTSGYERFFVLWSVNTDNDNYRTDVIAKDLFCTISYSRLNDTYSRRLKISDNNIVFDPGYKDSSPSATVNNSYIIPCKIIGYKH
jgi:hypothetical protein